MSADQIDLVTNYQKIICERDRSMEWLLWIMQVSRENYNTASIQQTRNSHFMFNFSHSYIWCMNVHCTCVPYYHRIMISAYYTSGTEEIYCFLWILKNEGVRAKNMIFLHIPLPGMLELKNVAYWLVLGSITHRTTAKKKKKKSTGYPIKK